MLCFSPTYDKHRSSISEDGYREVLSALPVKHTERQLCSLVSRDPYLQAVWQVRRASFSVVFALQMMLFVNIGVADISQKLQTCHSTDQRGISLVCYVQPAGKTFLNFS